MARLSMISFVAAFLVAVAVDASAYTATITDAQASGPGVCLRVTICWGPGEVEPTHENTSAVAWEVDDESPDDPCGEDIDGGDPIAGTDTFDPETGIQCRDFWFCFPETDCEHIFPNEEYSGTVTVNGMTCPMNGADGKPFSKNIC